MRSTIPAMMCVAFCASAARAGTAILCAAWCVSAARADIVHFVNPAPGEPGHYPWHGAANNWLDITRPFDQQPNVQSGDTVGQVREELWGVTYIWHMPVSAAPVSSLLRSQHSDFSAEPLLAGAAIGASAWWHTMALHAEVQWIPHSVNSLFPEGERRFIGVQTAEGRFGWVEVERRGENLDAFAWAYETVPGVPILAGQIPAPGAALLLGLGAFTLTRRRRS